MAVGLLGNKSPDSNRFILVTPKPENGVRLQATLGNQNPMGLPMGAVSYLCSDNASFINGENIVVDGGMSKVMIYHNDEGWELHK